MLTLPSSSQAHKDTLPEKERTTNPRRRSARNPAPATATTTNADAEAEAAPTQSAYHPSTYTSSPTYALPTYSTTTTPALLQAPLTSAPSTGTMAQYSAFPTPPLYPSAYGSPAMSQYDYAAGGARGGLGQVSYNTMGTAAGGYAVRYAAAGPGRTTGMFTQPPGGRVEEDDEDEEEEEEAKPVRPAKKGDRRRR